MLRSPFLAISVAGSASVSCSMPVRWVDHGPPPRAGSHPRSHPQRPTSVPRMCSATRTAPRGPSRRPRPGQRGLERILDPPPATPPALLAIPHQHRGMRFRKEIEGLWRPPRLPPLPRSPQRKPAVSTEAPMPWRLRTRGGPAAPALPRTWDSRRRSSAFRCGGSRPGQFPPAFRGRKLRYAASSRPG